MAEVDHQKQHFLYETVIWLLKLAYLTNFVNIPIVPLQNEAMLVNGYDVRVQHLK